MIIYNANNTQFQLHWLINTISTSLNDKSGTYLHFWKLVMWLIKSRADWHFSKNIKQLLKFLYKHACMYIYLELSHLSLKRNSCQNNSIYHLHVMKKEYNKLNWQWSTYMWPLQSSFNDNISICFASFKSDLCMETSGSAIHHLVAYNTCTSHQNENHQEPYVTFSRHFEEIIFIVKAGLVPFW